jgi:hypothetical protein
MALKVLARFDPIGPSASSQSAIFANTIRAQSAILQSGAERCPPAGRLPTHATGHGSSSLTLQAQNAIIRGRSGRRMAQASKIWLLRHRRVDAES